MTSRFATPLTRTLAALFLIALLPLLISDIDDTMLARRLAEENTQQKILRVAQQAAEQEKRILAETRTLLDAMKGISSIIASGAAACREFFSKRLELSPGYLDMGLIQPDGKIACSAGNITPQNETIPLWQSRAGTGAFVVRAFRADGGKSRPVALLTAPVMATEPRTAVFAALELGNLLPPPPGISLKPGESLLLADSTGTVLAHYPDQDKWAGKNIAASALARALMQRDGGNHFEASGPDGVSRVYGTARVADSSGQLFYVAAGMPPETGFLDYLFYLQVAAVVAAFLLAILLAGIGTDWVVLDQLHGLLTPIKLKPGNWHWPRFNLLPGKLGLFWAALLNRAAEQELTKTKLQEANELLRQSVEQLRQRTREISMLNEVSHLLQTCLHAEEIYALVAKYAPRLFPGHAGALFMVNHARHLVEAGTSWGKRVEGKDIFTPDECWALRLGKSRIVPSRETGPRCSHLTTAPPLGYLCVPLMAYGEIMGSMQIQPMADAPDRNIQDEQQVQARLQLAEAFAERVAFALANLASREALRTESIHDPLTGLYNRRFMEETLSVEERRATRTGSAVGVIMLDIDHFKRFNDTYGHAAGDTMLRALGTFLSEQVREGDIACRYGGEEFTVILPGANLEITRQRAEALCKAVSGLTVRHEDKQLGPVTLSLGVASFPERGTSWQTALKAADAALYQAKQMGRNRVEVA